MVDEVVAGLLQKRPQHEVVLAVGGLDGLHVARRGRLDVRLVFLVGLGDAGVLHDGLEDEVGARGALKRVGVAGEELLRGAGARVHLQQRGERGAVGRGVGLVLVEVLLALVVDDGLGHLGDGGVVQHVILHVSGQVGVLQVLLHAGAHLLHGGPAVGVLQVLGHPVVGELGGRGLLDVVDGDGEGGVLAVEVVHAVVVGEGDLDVEGLAGLVADELLQEVVDVLCGADGHRGTVAVGAAAVELHAVDLAHVVDVDGVAVGHLLVGDLLGGAVVGHDAVHLGLHVVIGGHHAGGGSLDGGVVGGQGHVVEGPDAAPMAVLVDALAVVELDGLLLGVGGVSVGAGRRVGGVVGVGRGLGAGGAGLGAALRVVGRGRALGVAAVEHGGHEHARHEQGGQARVGARQGQQVGETHEAPFGRRRRRAVWAGCG